MTDEAEAPAWEEEEAAAGFQFPEPLHLVAPDGTHYAIACEGTLCSILGVDQVPAYRATDRGLEWLTPMRRWESVEAGKPNN